MQSRIFMLLLAGSLTACAGVDVKRVTSANQGGIRYWRPAPYLALTETKTDKSVTCDVKALYLPDKTEEYAITIRAGMGATKATPTLQDGWNLTSLSADVDSKANENITALAGLLKVGLSSGTVNFDGTSTNLPTAPTCQGLYKVVYDASGNLTGFRRVNLTFR